MNYTNSTPLKDYDYYIILQQKSNLLKTFIIELTQKLKSSGSYIIEPKYRRTGLILKITSNNQKTFSNLIKLEQELMEPNNFFIGSGFYSNTLVRELLFDILPDREEPLYKELTDYTKKLKMDWLDPNPNPEKLNADIDKEFFDTL